EYFFFFSSRRRHTRCLSDWSSDVCSSDLRTNRRERNPSLIIAACKSTSANDHANLSQWGAVVQSRSDCCVGNATHQRPGIRKSRSEERRVGKECRSRCGQEH